MTAETMEWLNQNRHRSYPMSRDEWRERVSPQSGIDGVVLDALLFDTDPSASGDLVVERISVSSEDAVVSFSYGGKAFDVHVPRGEASGSGSFARVCGSISGVGRGVTASFAFSSLEYLLGSVGEGVWEIGCRVLPSRVVRITDGHGVDSVATCGSDGVDGRSEAASADGDVVLEDGYRTSPVVLNGRVFVRVGRRYGLDPCGFDYGDAASRDCRKPLFFFCGQNAVNGGNIVLKGGPGITVRQGGSYAVRDGSCAGKTVPAIEIVAGRELLDLFRPAGDQEPSV